MVEGASFTSRFNIDNINGFRFVEKIVIDMILYCMHCSTLSQ